jgi:glucose-1-phosphate thymidylyltransferase
MIPRLRAGEFVRVLQSRQGQLIASPEEIAFYEGWIDRDRLAAAGASSRKLTTGVPC